MTNRSKRAWLLLIWIAGYVACIVLQVVFLALGGTQVESLAGYIDTVTFIYVPYLSPIFTFWFVRRKAVVSAEVDDRAPFGVAAAISILFNAIMLFLLCFTLTKRMSGAWENVLQTMSKIGVRFSVLIGPALGYFFGKDWMTHAAAQHPAGVAAGNRTDPSS